MDKDPLLTARSTIRGKDSKGRDLLKVYINPETAQQLIDIISQNLENPRGVKLTFHTEKKQSQQGRQFYSTFFFANGVEDREGTVAPAQPVTRFKPKGPVA